VDQLVRGSLSVDKELFKNSDIISQYERLCLSPIIDRQLSFGTVDTLFTFFPSLRESIYKTNKPKISSAWYPNGLPRVDLSEIENDHSESFREAMSQIRTRFEQDRTKADEARFSAESGHTHGVGNQASSRRTQ